MDIGQLENKLERRPHSPLYARLADEYIKIGKLAEAKELCLSGLRRYPAYSIVHVVLARCYYAQQDYQSALEEAHLALTIYPESGVIKDLIQKCLDGINPPPPVQEPEPQSEPAIGESQELVAEDQAVQEPVADGRDADDTAEFRSEEVSGLPIEEPVGEMINENMPAPMEHDEIPSDEDVPEPESPVDGGDAVGMDVIFHAQPVVEETEVEVVQPASVEPLEIADENVPAPPDNEAELQAGVLEEPVAENVREVAQDAVPQDEQISQDNETAIEIEQIEVPPVAETPESREKKIQDPDDGGIVSQTLAEIYARQGLYDEAILTYKLLRRRRPEKAEEFDNRIKELEAKLQVKSED
jgi:tetratricopeptide (TPR) repeat protein